MTAAKKATAARRLALIEEYMKSPASAAVRVDLPEGNARRMDREAFASLMVQSGGFSFSGADFRLMSGPLVYMFLEGDRVLYVGMSRNGMSRCATPRHRQAAEAQSECDQVMIWPTRTVADAQALEGLLIGALRPRYNKQGHYTTFGRRMGISKPHSQPALMLDRQQATAMKSA